MTAVEKVAYSVAEAAVASGMSANAIRQAITRGDLRAYKPTAKVLVLHEDLIAWIKSGVAA